ncbi:MAG: hypothetical protein VB133_15180 [Anaeromusa sp.]|uniref:hypothetical protein n=1 Tax=Anaeromusa sp. TaxID=1872520 RepID=UPI002B1F6D77|nr:hypothetical protein [Anaeromusa sp.]MEA4836458.1 hypothetical protein [Anaeromusa sp.]
MPILPRPWKKNRRVGQRICRKRSGQGWAGLLKRLDSPSTHRRATINANYGLSARMVFDSCMFPRILSMEMKDGAGIRPLHQCEEAGDRPLRRKSASLSDLADKSGWVFDEASAQNLLPPGVIEDINAFGHAFRGMD